ncbi:hypothetical protein DPX16_3646 [Anabarilius grahami]|uniref:Uncharacterized protein n=1 Tax=Anabarilius grahami TaxID=495550 RepID=A0A3N0YKL5_ANAGA|nr:hypothetical protein DPX16_3646 [Anabarilius grahami]
MFLRPKSRALRKSRLELNLTGSELAGQYEESRNSQWEEDGTGGDGESVQTCSLIHLRVLRAASEQHKSDGHYNCDNLFHLLHRELNAVHFAPVLIHFSHQRPFESPGTLVYKPLPLFSNIPAALKRRNELNLS